MVVLNTSLSHIPFAHKRSSRRKSLGLKIVHGQLIVYSPTSASLAEVSAWVNQQSSWILKHYQSREAPKSLVPDDIFYWLGEPCSLDALLMPDGPIAPLLNTQSGANLSCYFFSQPLKAQKQLLLQALGCAAHKDLPNRVDFYQRQLSLYARSITLKPYKSRWGSCTNRKELSLNILLMMAPSWVRDYVVVHELCHLQHLNHSARFWAEVGRACDKQQVLRAKQWLKSHSDHLLFCYR